MTDSPILSGWKAIAEYLGCGIDTARKYQGQGMPVRTLDGGLALSSKDAIHKWVLENLPQEKAEKLP